MKPRNKLEREVADINATLSEDISAESFELVKQDCDNWGMRRNSYKNYVGYFAITGAIVGEWEIKRIYRLYKRESKSITHYFAVEIMREYNNLKGDKLYFSKNRTIGGCYYDTFSFSSEITLKSTYRNWAGNSITDLPEYVLASFPELGGERVDCLREDPNTIIKAILDNPVGENLYKQDDPLFQYLLRGSYSKQICRAITLAKRHGFVFNDQTTPIWFDMVRAIIFCKKDWRNPVYIAPKDLRDTHDKFVDMRWRKRRKDLDMRRRAAEERRHQEEVNRLQARLEKDKTDNEKYIKRRKRFYGMVLTDGLIECRVLEDVQAFKDEAEVMKHCVYRCEYFNKPYSLILSARIGGVRIETIEVDLKQYKILQCYGKHDHFTMYHKRILNLVKSQMETIKQYTNNRIKKAV